MFKDQKLDTGIEGDKLSKTPEELENIRKAKEEEERYKKELEQLQEEERLKIDEKLTEEERQYAELKAKEEEKQKRREANLEKILNFNFDEDNESLGDVDLDDILSDTESDSDDETFLFSYRDDVSYREDVSHRDDE